jgi:hypothetical protein
MRVAGVGNFETRSGWRVRMTGNFSLAGAGVFFYPPPGFPPVAIPRPTGQTGLALQQHRLRFFGLGFVDQPRNPVVFW